MGEEIPEQGVLDTLSRSDELQVMTIQLLKEIRDKDPAPIQQTTPAALIELLELQKKQHNIDFEVFTLTYPRDGTRLTIAAGTTTFDFLAGTVAAPGVDVADMGNSLMLQRKEFMRALFINADTEIVIRIGSGDKIPVRGGVHPLFPYRQFTTVEITVTKSTEILISASTSSAAIIQMQGEVSPSSHAFTGEVYENEHTMTGLEGWDVSSAVYLQNFSVATQEIDPHGLFFKPDGLKMYVIGNAGGDVTEYDLGTAWDVSSAVYLQNFSVTTQETSPHGLFFKPDGLKMYVIGNAGDDVNEYDLGTAWDVSSAVYLQNFSISSEEPSPRGLFFSPDGLKMYVTGYIRDDVNEYDLSPAWDVSSAVYLQNFSVATQETSPEAVFFSPDGTKMYVIGAHGDDVNEYDLGTAWDVSSAVYLQNFSISSEEQSPQGLFFSPDGTKMYVIGAHGDDVNEYDLHPYRFETSELLLRDFTYRISTNDAKIGDSNHQRYPKSAGSAYGLTMVDLSKLYFKNALPANNTKINILGVRL